MLKGFLEAVHQFQESNTRQSVPYGIVEDFVSHLPRISHLPILDLASQSSVKNILTRHGYDRIYRVDRNLSSSTQTDLLNLPFTAGRFIGIWSYLPNMPEEDYAEAFLEAQRVIVPDRPFSFTVPALHHHSVIEEALYGAGFSEVSIRDFATDEDDLQNFIAT